MATYDYWQAALRLTDGKRQLTREEMTSLRISEDDVGLGFFRMRSVPREPFSTAVAIWLSGEMLVTAMNGWNIAAPASQVWLSVCKYPIHEDLYRSRMEGQKWPTEEE